MLWCGNRHRPGRAGPRLFKDRYAGGAPMNSEVEIHDSTLASITPDGHDLVLCLAPAYVHRSAGRPGIDQGSGWLQDIDLVISEAVVESLPSEFPVDLSDGSFSVGEV